jgi:hypothetical protein
MASNGFNHFAALAAALPEICEQVVTKTALDVKSNVQAQIVANGQVDTGNMLNSVEVEDGEDAQTKYIKVGAEYAPAQNYGTRFMAGRPFWEPGWNKTRPDFEAAIAAIQNKLNEVSH